MTLPPRMRSGRELVAVNEARTVGLYGSAQDGYRVLLADGAVIEGEAFGHIKRPYPRCPDGKWFWRRGEKSPVRKKRRTQRDRERAFQETMTKHEQAETPLSASHRCADCQRDVRPLSHAHSAADQYGYPVALCCRCARQNRNVACLTRERARRESGGTESAAK